MTEFGTVKNLVIWTNPTHPRPVRLNDHELTIDETRALIQAVTDALTESEAMKSEVPNGH